MSLRNALLISAAVRPVLLIALPLGIVLLFFFSFLFLYTLNILVGDKSQIFYVGQ